MIRLTRSYYRSSTNVPWHYEIVKTTMIHQVIQQFTNSGIVNESKIVSEDGLTITYTLTFPNQECLDQYQTNTSLLEYWRNRNRYCESVNITIGPANLETI